MSNYEGTAEFTYDDGEQHFSEISWSPAFSDAPYVGSDNSAGRVKHRARFSVASQLKRPNEFVTITFADQKYYGYYDNPTLGSDSVSYTFHSQAQ